MKKSMLLFASILVSFLFLPIMTYAAKYSRVTIITPKMSVMPITTSDCQFISAWTNEKTFIWPKAGSSSQECQLSVRYDGRKIDCRIRLSTQNEPTLSSCPTADFSTSGETVRVNFK